MQIIFEDYYLLAVNKPAGLSSESGGAKHTSAEDEALLYFTKTLQKTSTSKRLKLTPYLKAIHRLDRPTSGVLLFAKTKTALTQVMAQFEQRETEKTYWAVVEKMPKQQSGELRHWLLRSEDGKKAILSDIQVRNSQLAILDYSFKEMKNGKPLLEIKPKTGRFHQIRAQLASIGCPVIGDVAYGAKPWQDYAIMLHAHQLVCTHPKTQEPLILEAFPEW